MDNVAVTYYYQKELSKCDSICEIIKQSENVPAIVMGTALYLPAFYAENRGEFSRAEKEFNLALEYFKVANDSIKIPLILRHLGTIYKRQGFPAKALKYYLEAIPYYEPGSETHVLVINLYNSINNIFYEHKNYQQAFEYSSRILDLQHLIKAEEHKQFYNFLHAKNLAAINKSSEADSLFSSSYQYFINDNPKSPYKLMVMVGLFGKSLKDNDMKKAGLLLDSLDHNISKLKPSHKTHSLIKLKLEYAKHKSEFYLKEKNYPKLTEALAEFNYMLEKNEDLELRHLYHKYSYELQKVNGNFISALDHFEKAQVLSDSIFTNEQMVLLQDMEYTYNKKEQQNQIALLNSQNELSVIMLQSLSRRNIIFGSAFLCLCIVSLSLYWLYQKIRKKNIDIKIADQEKTVLLQEIHHRVKNNLQVISSLLALQGKYISDDHALDALRQGQDRVQSMALIHQDLYQTNNLKGVNTQDYFEQVVDNLFDSYNISEEDITLELEVAPLMLDVDTMIPLGLVINELVSNSLKHAFKKESNGKIEVKLKEVNQELILKVSDNGKGIVSLNEIEGKSFGYELIKAFAKKLKAEIAIDNSEGFAIELRIKNYKTAA